MKPSRRVISDGCEKSTAKFFTSKPNRERLVGPLTRQVLYRMQPGSERRDYKHEFCMGNGGGGGHSIASQRRVTRPR